MPQAKAFEYKLYISIKQCFELIVMGSDSEITDGWTILEALQESKEFNPFINCENILKNTLSGEVRNVSEVPKIMAWSSPYITKKIPPYTDPISNNVAILLHKADLNDMSELAALLETMLDYRVYLPKSANHTAICEAVIMSLSTIQMPKDPDKILKFNYNISKIQNFLKVVYSDARNEDPDIMTTCLQTLYNIISDANLETMPGPGLAAILHLVEPFIIAQSVDWILSQSQADYKLIQALLVLFSWLPKWRGEPLSTWIMEFIYGLEKQERYSILLHVSESSLLDISELMYKILLIPLFRQNSSVIIFHILRRITSTLVIQNIVKKIPMLVQNLMVEDSDSSRECAQNLIDYLKVISLRYPENHIYDKIGNTLPMSPRMHIVNEICQQPMWIDTTGAYESMPIHQRHSSEKIGLCNLGNTCYMNSVLQALFMTRQFCYEVLNYTTDKIPLLRKLQNLFALLLYSKRVFLSSTDILQALRPTYFLPGQQQDSSEFLCYLLDVLHEQEKSANTNCSKNGSANNMQCKTKVQSTEQPPSEMEGGIKRWTTEEDLTEGAALQRKTQSLANLPQGEDAGKIQLSNNHSDSTDSGIQSVGGDEAGMSLIHRVLGGESKVTLQCAQCDTCSHNTDRFRDLQLCFPEELQESQEISVQDLINYYLRPEKLTDDNRYQCDKCTTLCDAQRIITILQAPAHLILSLKHFRYDFSSTLRTKLSHKVVYNDTIKLPVSAGSSMLTETYHLYAAVVHSGHNMDYGHYFTYARDSKQDWYKFNDNYVSETSLEAFKSLEPPDTPYILFYEKSELHDKIYEDSKPELSKLNKHLQELVEIDSMAFGEEMKQYIISQCRKYPILSNRRYDNSDDENPPSSNCRNAINIPANRFLY